MALIKAGRPENDKGKPFVVGLDPDTNLPVSFGIRSIPEAQLRKIQDKYGFEKEVEAPYEDQGPSGERRRVLVHIRKRVLSEDEWRLVQRDKALFAWVSSENL